MKQNKHPSRRIQSKNTGQDRRSAMKSIVLAGAAVLVTGIPLASYVVSPALDKGTGKWIDLGAAEGLKPGEMTMLSYEFMVKDGWLVLPQRGFVWARTESEGRVTVFSSTCTHLACSVIWRDDQGIFECPCHSGRYDGNGRPIAGPPTRPLAVLEHKVEDGRLMVLLKV